MCSRVRERRQHQDINSGNGGGGGGGGGGGKGEATQDDVTLKKKESNKKMGEIRQKTKEKQQTLVQPKCEQTYVHKLGTVWG